MIKVTGEVDRLFFDILFFLMYETNRTKPPNSNHGVNHYFTFENLSNLRLFFF